MPLPSAKNYLDELDFTESGNWNNAKQYAELMIMRYLAEADYYERVAKFGMSNYEERFMFNKEMIILNRLDALDWFVETLLRIIDNSLFAIKSKDKKLVDSYYNFIVEIEKLLPTVRIGRQEFNKVITEINEEKFQKILKHLTQIRRALTDPLNRADLIFTHREEFDPTVFKQKVKDRLINIG